MKLPSAPAPALDNATINTRKAGVNPSRGPLPTTKLDGTRLTDDSGDKWEIQTRRRDYYECGEGRFVVVFIELFRLMYQRRLPGEARAVVDWLCANITTDNLVSGVSQRQIATDTGILAPHVSRALGILAQHGIAVRRGPGEILLNPRYCFVGKPTRQHRAVKEWDGLIAERRRAEIAADAKKRA